MNKTIFDLYSDYLLSSFGQVTATGLARLLDGDLSHDQVTRTLADEKLNSKSWWQLVKPFVRQIERPGPRPPRPIMWWRPCWPW